MAGQRCIKEGSNKLLEPAGQLDRGITPVKLLLKTSVFGNL